MSNPEQQLGSYKLVSRIGAGGMGEVWKAEDTRLGRLVAIKILPARIASDSDAIGRMRREARTAAQLNHPNIATIHSFEEAEGRTFIVMEFVAGEPLSALIRSRSLTEADVCRIGRSVAEALAEAHEKGIVHRDVKPDNVIVAGPRVKVLDFGIAKRVGVEATTADSPTAFVTQQGMILGTVHYMSPEQALGKSIDPRTDLFSLGVVLYEAATSRLPFSGETVTETITQIIRDEPQAPRAVNPAISPELNEIIQRCLRKNREERFATASDLAAALESQLARMTTDKRQNPNIAAIGPMTAKQQTILTGSKLQTVEEPPPLRHPVRRTPAPVVKRKRAVPAGLIAIAIIVLALVIVMAAVRNRSAKRSEAVVATASAQPASSVAAAAPPPASTLSVTAPPAADSGPSTQDRITPATTTPPAGTTAPAISTGRESASVVDSPASPTPVAEQPSVSAYDDGMRLLGAGDFAAAGLKFAEAAEANPQNARARFRLGEIALLGHRQPYAAEQFRRALQNGSSLEARERALTQLGLAVATNDRARANVIAREIHRFDSNDPDLIRIHEAYPFFFGPEREPPPVGGRPRRRPFRP